MPSDDRRVRPVDEVLLDVVRGCLAAPAPHPSHKREADRALGPDAKLAKDARGFHDDDAARAIVGRRRRRQSSCRSERRP